MNMIFEQNTRHRLRSREQDLNANDLARLNSIRNGALEDKNAWYKSIQVQCSAGVMAMAVAAVFIFPANFGSAEKLSLSFGSEIAQISHFEEPEFYLWLAENETLMADL